MGGYHRGYSLSNSNFNVIASDSGFANLRTQFAEIYLCPTVPRVLAFEGFRHTPNPVQVRAKVRLAGPTSPAKMRRVKPPQVEAIPQVPVRRVRRYPHPLTI